MVQFPVADATDGRTARGVGEVLQQPVKASYAA
jgi:hypothetical protein